MMTNKLIPNSGCGITPVHQQAEKITNIEKVANLHQTNNILFMTNSLPGTPGAIPTPVTYSHDYYNLIVYGQVPMYTDCHITLGKDRCLVELKHITEELRDRFSPLTPSIIEELKGFLCILACENKHMGWTEEDHKAWIAQLTDIKNRSNGIELYLHPMFPVSQARISEHLFEFGISGRYKRYNELNHSHWTVKEINLMEVLNDTGLNPFNL